MAKKRQAITVTVGLDGVPEVAVEGCPGKSCKALSSDIEKALGGVKADRLTEEYKVREPDVRLRH